MPEKEEKSFDPPKKKVVKKKKVIKKKKKVPKPEVKKKTSFGDPEVDEAFKRMDKMRSDILSQLEKIYTEGGISPQDVSKFLDDSANFPKETFEKVQQDRENLLDGIWVKLGKKDKERHIKKKKKKVAKARKRKTLGGRKKWIPMR